MTYRGIAAAGAALLAIGGCAKLPRVSTTTTTSAPMIAANDDAAIRVTSARCNREAACDDIGAGKKYADRQACARELGRSDRAELRSEVCPNGIDESHLSSCMAEIRSDRCDAALGTIGRLPSCRTERLCADAVERSD